MKRIDAIDNPTVKLLLKLHMPKGRELHRQFIAEGFRTCETLVTSAIQLVQLYVTEDKLAQAQAITADHITVVTYPIMNKISTSTTPSGILGVFEIPANPSLDELTSGLVLAQISDPGNMGTLLRSAAAMNVRSVVIIDGTDIWSPKVIQATAGSIGKIKLFKLSWFDLVTLKKRPTLSALVVSGGKNPKELDDKKRLLIVGSEAHGIPEEWLVSCDEQITLPMSSGVESLNAAVAGSIAMYLVFNK